MPIKHVTYNSNSFTDTQPVFAPGTIYGSDFKFANKTINANLGDNTFGHIEIKVSWTRASGNPTLDISKGDVVLLHVQHPQGAECAIAEKAADGNHVFFRVDSTQSGYVEMALTPYTDSGGSEKTFIFIANANPDLPSEASYVMNLAVGLRKNRAPHAGSFNVEYSCVKPVYKYEMGVHPYSPYDSAYSPEHTMDLYALSPIDGWGVGTRAYWDSHMSYPAPSYYFSQMPANGNWPSAPVSGTNPVVYKFGDEVDRGFGIARYYQAVKKWAFGKTRVHKKMEGPKSYHFTVPGDDRPDKMATCCIPQMTNVGKVTELVVSQNLVNPSLYKYYLAYDASNATSASEKAFGYYHWSKKRYYRISGIRHILEKWMQGYQKGYIVNWDPDWWTFGSLGFGGGYFLVGMLTDFNKIGQGSPWLQRTFKALWNFDSGVGPFADKIGQAIWKFFGGKLSTAKGAAAYQTFVGVLGGIFVAFMIIKALISLFKTTRKNIKEPCLELEHTYHSNPYIKTGAPIWNTASTNTKSYGYFTDGIQDYHQTSQAGNVNSISYQSLYSLVGPDPIEFQYQHAPKTRTGTKLLNNEEIMSLLYVAGIPVGPCSGTNYYSVQKSTTVLSNAGALENCPSGQSIILPAGYGKSCLSQAHADGIATRYFDQIVAQAEEHVNERECDLITTHGHMGVEFTHEIKIETHQNFTDVFWDTSSHNYTTSLNGMIGATLYLDEQGRYTAPDGFYCNSQAFNAPNNSSAFKVFYEVNSTISPGRVVDVWKLNTSSSSSATSSGGQSPQSLSTYKLDYRSDWVILKETPSQIEIDYRIWASDPLNLVTLEEVTAYPNVYKARTQEQSNSLFEMEIWNGSQWEEAEEGWYGNLVGWPPIDGQFEPGDIYRYIKSATIKVSVESVCPTSEAGVPYGSNIVFRSTGGELIEPGEKTTLTLNARESNSTLETRVIDVGGTESSIYSPHSSISTFANIDEYTFTDLPKVVGKRTFNYDASANSLCNPIEYDLVVSHQLSQLNGVTTATITVTSDIGLGIGTFYYTDLNNSVSGNYLASGSNSATTGNTLSFAYSGLPQQEYDIEIITPSGKNTRYVFTPIPTNNYTGDTMHTASDSSSTQAVSNWTIASAPATFNLMVFSGLTYTGQSTTVRFRLYNNVGGALLTTKMVTAGPPGYGTETDTYTISSTGSYQWIVDVTATTGSSLAGYGQVSLQ